MTNDLRKIVDIGGLTDDAPRTTGAMKTDRNARLAGYGPELSHRFSATASHGKRKAGMRKQRIAG